MARSTSGMYSCIAPKVELALTDLGVCPDKISIQSDGRLVFGDSFVKPVLRPPHVALGKMRLRAARRGSHSLQSQQIRPCDVGRRCFAQLIRYASYEH